MNEIKFSSISQFRSFARELLKLEWDDKVTIEQRELSRAIVLSNRKGEIRIDGTGGVFKNV